MPEVAREYRDRLFCFIFGSEAHKDWTLSLYNAVNKSHYTNSDDIVIATLTEVVYMGMHNDVAFLISDEINMYEQQSTFNPNMPLRLMQYTGNIYDKLIKLGNRNKFGKTLIPLPVPKLVVFYNGTREAPDETTLNLSDAFPEDKHDASDIAVRVRMININGGRSPEVMSACKPLDEYTWLVDRIREREREMPLEQAVDITLDEMPDDYLIRPYLEANRAEVRTMLLTEYDEARTMEMFKAEGRAEGRLEGRREGRLEGRLEGRREGRAEGETRLGTLISRLKALGRVDDAFRAAADPSYREALYAEFGIS